MDKNISQGTRVTLVTFHGTSLPTEPVRPEENYWKLVGTLGEVISEFSKIHLSYPDNGARVLVKFDNCLDSMGLENHNDVSNSLWVFQSDLQVAD